jgi:hypothetical protein
LFAGLPGCPPLLGVNVEGTRTSTEDSCREFNEAVLERASRDDVATVVLAAHWPLYATGVRYGREAAGHVRLGDADTDPAAAEANAAVLRRALERTAATLAEAGKEVVIVGPIPEIRAPVPWTLALAAWHGRDIDIRPTRDAFEARNDTVLAVLAGLVERGLVRVVHPHHALCDDDRCRVEGEGRALYTDDNHLSRRGAEAIAARAGGGAPRAFPRNGPLAGGRA